MPPSAKRLIFLCSVAAIFILGLYQFTDTWSGYTRPAKPSDEKPASAVDKGYRFAWKDVPIQHPVASMIPLPMGQPVKIPKIQYEFMWSKETKDDKIERERRADTIRKAFARTWTGYTTHAWLKDELLPISGQGRNVFGGWAATLVDSLDTLHIMGFKKNFNQAINALAKVDFSRSTEDEINVFETAIRYLGGFLSAYDLSGNSLLLDKAVQVGEMLYVAFDTPNRMPIPRWHWRAAAEGASQVAPEVALLAEVGSLSLEFTRLSQLSGDPKYFDAIERITEHFLRQQNSTKLPGLWPITVNLRTADLTADHTFSLGAMADSTYEYLVKMYMLLGGLDEKYRTLYEFATNTAINNLFVRVPNPENQALLTSGIATVKDGNIQVEHEGQHLACFAGGMVGIGAKIFERGGDLQTARRLVDACIWAYNSMPSGIMPEHFKLMDCTGDCVWDEKKWHRQVLLAADATDMPVEEIIAKERLPPGFTSIIDPRYILRPETIESIFILYRITGDRKLQEKAWEIWQAVEKHTITNLAFASLEDVTIAEPKKTDRMESFWPAETLKYFYLIFSDPSVISLDDYVFNTEAHPFRRPKS